MKELEYLINKKINIKYNVSDEHIFVIGAWIDSIEKEKILVKCIKRLREFNIPILLVAHCKINEKIINLVDHFLYDMENPLLYFNDFKNYNLNNLRYILTDSYTINSYVDFHHDYAVLTNIRNAINFSLKSNKKYFHYLEYDNIIDTKQYYQTFINDIIYNDAIIYEYDKGSVSKGYCAAYIFSIKMNIAEKILQDIGTINEHFRRDDWRMENYILNSIKKYTNNIKITNYIDNEQNINICYIWNRQILKNFLYHIVVDNNDNLYLAFANSEDYLIEIKYDEYNKFHNIFGYQLINLGKYKINKTIQLRYLGLNLDSKILNEPIEKFREKNNITFK